MFCLSSVGVLLSSVMVGIWSLFCVFGLLHNSCWFIILCAFYNCMCVANASPTWQHWSLEGAAYFQDWCVISAHDGWHVWLRLKVLITMGALQLKHLVETMCVFRNIVNWFLEQKTFRPGSVSPLDGAICFHWLSNVTVEVRSRFNIFCVLRCVDHLNVQCHRPRS